MLFDFIELKTLYLIAHIFGAILGAGGAFASDAMFFSTIKDGRVTEDEIRFMRLGGKLVWSGMALLVLSGIFLVSTDPAGYLNSDKFLAKVTIVAIIIINGIIFHLRHLPHISAHLNITLANSPSFMKGASFLLMSGALSMVSWISTVILGMLKNVPWSYIQIMSLYAVIIFFALIAASLMKRFYLFTAELKH